MAKILVVEDNHDYQELLQNFLENACHEVKTAHSGTKALELIGCNPFDLILLDLMLPDMDGFDVCESIRKTYNTPIIMLTALGSEAYQMRGYELNIDDYITKPISMALLLHKVQAVLCRTIGSMSTRMPEVLRFNNISLDLKAHTVNVAGQPVDFTLREFEILQELMQAPGIVITRKMLIEKLWGYDFYGDSRIVDTHMKNIRRKLGLSADCIETIRGVGYKLRNNSPERNQHEKAYY